MESSSLHNTSSVLVLVPTGGGFAGILTYQSMSALLQFREFITSISQGIECSLAVSGELCTSSTCVSSSSSIQVSCRACHGSIQTSTSHFTLLIGVYLASHCSQLVGRCSSLMSHHERSFQGCFVKQGSKESTLTAFNPLTA